MVLTALLLCLHSCVKDVPVEQAGSFRLRPLVQGLATKAVEAAENDRDESKLGNHLDVFFQGAGTGNAGFWKEYHLSNVSFTDPAGELISENWVEDGFKATDSYNVYVILNGPDAAHRYVGSISALKYISRTDDDIYRVKKITGDYDVSDPEQSPYTDSKRLMMDGVVKGWSPVAGQSVQTVIMNLRRAAAKIEINITFDPVFLSTLTDPVETPGAAMYKYDNFSFSSPAIAEGFPVTPDIRSSKKGMWANRNTLAPSYTYRITTYSYACSWTAEESALTAPSILVSYLFNSAEGHTEHYYRIPVCAPGTLSLERNHIYKVNAIIDSKGSWKDTGEIPVNLTYSVLEWTDNQLEISERDETEPYFFDVEPAEKAIWGDGTRTVTLRYQAPSWADITIEAIPAADLASAGASEPGFSPTQTVGSCGYQAFYTDNLGAPQPSEVAGISIDTHNKTITVTSEALANRSPKNIRFRVWCDKTEPDAMYKDVYIRHFPADNIQSIPGWYSYKLDAGSVSAYTFDPVGDNWTTSMSTKKWDGLEALPSVITSRTVYEAAKDPEKFTKETVTDARSVQPVAGTYAWAVTEDNLGQGIFKAALVSSANRAYANGALKAVQGHSGEYATSYYYGTDPVSCTEAEADFSAGTEYYKYTEYHKITYYTGYARRYYRNASSYSWARYEYDFGNDHTSQLKVADQTSGSNYWFNSRFYNESDNKIYRMTETKSGSYWRTGQGTAESYSNNRIYIIQLTSPEITLLDSGGNPVAAGDVKLARPALDVSAQSVDDMLSPALMVASQLGTTFEYTDARKTFQTPARHCSLYVEVGKNGKVYTGWRLPTKSEIRLINNYELRTGDKAVVLAPIFTGKNVCTLDGTSTEVEGKSDTGTYLRCVRDMTAEEAAELNRIK